MEKQFIQWLSQRLPAPKPPAKIGIGDDGAIIDQKEPMVIVTDTISDGVHFDFQRHTPEQIGHKAMAVNLSDIAAMGAIPFAATVNFNFPSGLQMEIAKAVFSGIESTAATYGTQIIGGDTNCWNGKLVITVTAFGTSANQKHGGFWKLNTARNGDDILVSGRLGGSIVRKHIEFQPRLSLAIHLANHHQVNACTDVTDSLSLDLAEMAKASRLGFEIDASTIPISDDAKKMAKADDDVALDRALYDGEDFELIISTDPKSADNILADRETPVPMTRIGRFDESGKFRILTSATQSEPLQIRGYEH